MGVPAFGGIAHVGVAVRVRVGARRPHWGRLALAIAGCEGGAMLTTTGAFSGFSVDDQGAALAFYRDTIGLHVEATPMGLELRLPGATVFVYEKADHVPATFTVLNFEVPDIDAAVGELEAAGVALQRYPDMPQDERGIVRGKAAGMGPDIAWFTDPAGNILSVLSS